jgi:amino-acid N-acetyltransferase
MRGNLRHLKETQRLAVLTMPAKPEHLAAARALLAGADLPVDGLEDQFPAGYVVAIRKGEFVGAAGVEIHGRDGLLRSLVVDAPRRGSGLGHTLTFDRIRLAKEQGVDALWLLTTTAAPFFARLGFVTVERARVPPALQASHEFATACPSSATCMWLDLAPVPTGVAFHAWAAGRLPRSLA